MYEKYVKRLLDIVVSLCALPFVLIVILIFAPIIYFTDQGPVFYLAERRGKNGEIFKMYKLRSMYVNAPDIRNADNSTFNSKNDSRVTPIGNFMRKCSIDELAQILNVLKGDMSWIGPRASAARAGYTWDDLNEIQQKRLRISPGITGYTAALYRNSISKEKKYEYDCYYADHVSFILDVKIVLWTVRSVLFRKNLYTNAEPDGIEKEKVQSKPTAGVMNCQVKCATSCRKT